MKGLRIELLLGGTVAALAWWCGTDVPPTVYDDVAAAAGLRPPLHILPGLWRSLAAPLFSLCGLDLGLTILGVLGPVALGVSVALAGHLFRLILPERIVALAGRTAWGRRIIAAVVAQGALLFAFSEPVWRTGRFLSPDALTLMVTIAALWLLARIVRRPLYQSGPTDGGRGATRPTNPPDSRGALRATRPTNPPDSHGALRATRPTDDDALVGRIAPNPPDSRGGALRATRPTNPPDSRPAGGAMLFAYVFAALAGLLAADTPVAFFVFAAFPVAFAGRLATLLDGSVVSFASPLTVLLVMRRMTRVFLAAWAAGLAAAVVSFMWTGGAEAEGWSALQCVGHAFGRYVEIAWKAATPLGWLLFFALVAMPLLVALSLASKAMDSEAFMPYRFGVLFGGLGLWSFLQCAGGPSCAFWRVGGGCISSGFLQCLAALTCALMAAVALCVLGTDLYFRNKWRIAQAKYSDSVADDPVAAHLVARMRLLGRVWRWLFVAEPFLVAGFLLSAPWRSAGVVRGMEDAVNACARLTAEECGDARLVVTDGELDAAVEVCAARRGRDLKALSLMSGNTPRETFIRCRAALDEEDRTMLAMGAYETLRTWLAEKPESMTNVAVQLGFELWRHLGRPLPAVGGLLAYGEASGAMVGRIAPNPPDSCPGGALRATRPTTPPHGDGRGDLTNRPQRPLYQSGPTNDGGPTNPPDSCPREALVGRIAPNPPGSPPHGALRATRPAAARACALAARMAALCARGAPDLADAKLKEMFEFALWRLARMARMRADAADAAGNTELALEEAGLADRLDACNKAYQRIERGLSWLGRKQGQRLTPREGLAFALVRADFRMAHAFARQVMLSEPANLQANFAAGMDYLAEEAYGRAEHHFRKVLTANPDEPAALNNLAVALLRQGRTEEAESQAVRALQLHPASPEIKATLEEIRRNGNRKGGGNAKP